MTINPIQLFYLIESSETTLAVNQLINEINALVAQAITSSGDFIGDYAVASLPHPPALGEGARAYALNGRKVAEGPGSGTGVPVYWSQSAWRVFSSDQPVAA